MFFITAWNEISGEFPPMVISRAYCSPVFGSAGPSSLTVHRESSDRILKEYSPSSSTSVTGPAQCCSSSVPSGIGQILSQPSLIQRPLAGSLLGGRYCPLYFGFTNKYAWPWKVTCITRPPSCGTITTFIHGLLISWARQPSKFLDSIRQTGELGVCADDCRGKKLAHSTVATSEKARSNTQKSGASTDTMK